MTNWHTAEYGPPPSIRTRMLAALCLCLLLLTSFIQVLHVHQDLQPVAQHATATRHAQFTGDTEATCPFCASLHATPYLGSVTSAHADRRTAPAEPVRNHLSTATTRHFALFTRPPPALL